MGKIVTFKSDLPRHKGGSSHAHIACIQVVFSANAVSTSIIGQPQMCMPFPKQSVVSDSGQEGFPSRSKAGHSVRGLASRACYLPRPAYVCIRLFEIQSILASCCAPPYQRVCCGRGSPTMEQRGGERNATSKWCSSAWDTSFVSSEKSTRFYGLQFRP